MVVKRIVIACSLTSNLSAKVATRQSTSDRLPPGRHDVGFVADAPRVYPPDDFRDLVFSVQDFRVSPVTAALVPGAEPRDAPGQ